MEYTVISVPRGHRDLLTPELVARALKGKSLSVGGFALKRKVAFDGRVLVMPEGMHAVTNRLELTLPLADPVADAANLVHVCRQPRVEGLKLQSLPAGYSTTGAPLKRCLLDVNHEESSTNVVVEDDADEKRKEKKRAKKAKHQKQ